jgi:hypothetical protein
MRASPATCLTLDYARIFRCGAELMLWSIGLLGCHVRCGAFWMIPLYLGAGTIYTKHIGARKTEERIAMNEK